MQLTRLLAGVLLGALLSATLPAASARADCCFVDGDFCFSLGESECGASGGIYDPNGSCVNGQCIQDPACSTSAECLDADACNGDESCVAGLCVAGAPLDCHDANPCLVGSCDPELGCRTSPVADGTSCSDGNPCNGDETCAVGSCAPGTALVCDDGNACTVGICDPQLGCRTSPVADGTSCSDGNPCNGDETCAVGSCAPGAALVCDDGNACTVGICDPELGCRTSPVADGTSCSDGNPCNGDETCAVGSCAPGAALVCDDGNACTVGICDPQLGCRTSPVADGTSCSDGNPCNGDETCAVGSCAPGTALVCDDGNACTVGICDPQLGCRTSPVADGTSCSDGNPCNGTETCAVGSCAPGTALVCDDGNACTVGICDPELGCRTSPVADGTSCSDGNPCNGTETCAVGSCAPGTALVCDDGNACTVGICDPQLGCRTSPVADGTSCSDGNPCNGDETCAVGSCAPGTALVCDDGNACTVGICDPELGCRTSPVADGTSCSDGNPCNGDETCAVGICSADTALACDDGNPCTVDACDPVLGCRATVLLDGTACDGDALACLGDGVCQQGVCRSEAPPVCDDGDVCNGIEICEIGFGCVSAVAVPPLVRLRCLVASLEVRRLCTDDPYPRALDRVVANHQRVLLRWIESLQPDRSPPRRVALLAMRRLLLETRRDILRRGAGLACTRDLIDLVDEALEVLMELRERGD